MKMENQNQNKVMLPGGFTFYKYFTRAGEKMMVPVFSSILIVFIIAKFTFTHTWGEDDNLFWFLIIGAFWLSINIVVVIWEYLSWKKLPLKEKEL